MIIENESTEAIIMVDDANIKSMTIEDNANSVMVLIDRLYAKKKPAVVRELGANACDAHKAAGRGDVPFEIIMPSAADPNLVFTDYGTGLSWEDTERYLGRLFSTSKDGENQSIGHYGLGSKAPHTVTDSYFIESRHGGLLTKSMWFRDGGQRPKFMKVSEEPYEGPTGITFRIPCDPEQNKEWINAIRSQTSQFNPRPKVMSLGVEVEGIYETEDLYGFGSVRVVKDKFLRNFFGRVAVNMGGVLYPLDYTQFSKEDDDEKETKYDLTIQFSPNKSEQMAIIDVPIGSVNIPPHREGLEYTDKTLETLDRVIKEANHKFKNEFMVAPPLDEMLKLSPLHIANASNEWLERTAPKNENLKEIVKGRISLYQKGVNDRIKENGGSYKHIDIRLAFAARGWGSDCVSEFYTQIEIRKSLFKRVDYVLRPGKDTWTINRILNASKAGFEAAKFYAFNEMRYHLVSINDDGTINCFKSEVVCDPAEIMNVAGMGTYAEGTTFLLPPDQEYNAPHRRFVYNHLNGMPLTPEALGATPLERVDDWLGRNSGKYRITRIDGAELEGELSPEDKLVVEEAITEIRGLMHKTCKTLVEFPAKISVRSKRKGAEEAEMLKGIRIWKTSGSGPVLSNDMPNGKDGVFYMHPGTMAKIGTSDDITRNLGNEMVLICICYDHPTLESVVHIDKERQMPVNKAMLQNTLATLATSMEGTNVRLVRISKTTEDYTDKIISMVEGVDRVKILDIKTAWNKWGQGVAEFSTPFPSLGIRTMYQSDAANSGLQRWLYQGSGGDDRFTGYSPYVSKVYNLIDDIDKKDFIFSTPSNLYDAIVYMEVYANVMRAIFLMDHIYYHRLAFGKESSVPFEKILVPVGITNKSILSLLNHVRPYMQNTLGKSLEDLNHKHERGRHRSYGKSGFKGPHILAEEIYEKFTKTAEYKQMLGKFVNGELERLSTGYDKRQIKAMEDIAPIPIAVE